MGFDGREARTAEAMTAKCPITLRMLKLLRKPGRLWEERGFQCVSKRTLRDLRRNTTNPDIYDWVNDREFCQRYETARVATDNPRDSLHIQRSYVLCEVFKLALSARTTAENPVHVAECGVLGGTTIHQLCAILVEQELKAVTHAFDSFEGLPGRTEDDVINRYHPERSLRRSWIGKWKGVLACPLETAQRNLAEFDFVRFYKGWIPERFADIAELNFRFVHIDVDLHDPVQESLNFFWPRMLPGGVVVLDDYGFFDWPGAKLATENFCQAQSLTPLRLPTGQAILFK
jgi:macrocin-O-methyltransferase TylF-like protien